MATAVITKAEQRQAEREAAKQRYIETAEIIEINEDGEGFYALVPSEDGSETYKVRFAEPRNKASYATDCDCPDRKYRKAYKPCCKHMTIVTNYFAKIHNEVRRTDIPYVAPVATRAKPAKPAKVRRSAVNEALVAEYNNKYSEAVTARAVARLTGEQCRAVPTQCPQGNSTMPIAA